MRSGEGEAVLSVLRSPSALSAHLNGGSSRRLTDQKRPSLAGAMTNI